jgi:UvrD-like helicase family protein
VSRIGMEEGELGADFEGREVPYGFGELDELVLAYATTIHKSQGSEYPAVVIPLTTQHYPMLQRNLVYTGVTRGKRLVVLIEQRKALAIAVKGARARWRWSKLREWLIGGGVPGARGDLPRGGASHGGTGDALDVRCGEGRVSRVLKECGYGGSWSCKNHAARRQLCCLLLPLVDHV